MNIEAEFHKRLKVIGLSRRNQGYVMGAFREVLNLPRGDYNTQHVVNIETLDNSEQFGNKNTNLFFEESTKFKGRKFELAVCDEAHILDVEMWNKVSETIGYYPAPIRLSDGSAEACYRTFHGFARAMAELWPQVVGRGLRPVVNKEQIEKLKCPDVACGWVGSYIECRMDAGADDPLCPCCLRIVELDD